jgi:hypothetical protein
MMAGWRRRRVALQLLLQQLQAWGEAGEVWGSEK